MLEDIDIFFYSNIISVELFQFTYNWKYLNVYIE